MTKQTNWIEKLYTIPVWKKYSQCNEECYLEHIFWSIDALNPFSERKYNILELGAWDGFHLSNTRYFIEKYFEKALLIDGDNKGNTEVKEHFVTRENILSLLEKYEMPKEFDFFCIDLDGNDIYVLEEVLSAYKPSVICAEFNPIFFPEQSFAIQYDAYHKWGNDDYYGFSFTAGIKMAEKFEYTCIFQNDNLNMYFVENNILAKSLNISVEEIKSHVPPVTYSIMNGHAASVRKDKNWVAY